MILLSVNDASVSFGDRELFSGVTFSVDEREHVGFVGANGAGKSTIFRVISGELAPTTGDVSRQKGLKVGYMHQIQDLKSRDTVLEDALLTHASLLETEATLARIENELLLCRDVERNVERQARLYDRFVMEGGLEFRARTRSALLGLGFSEEELSRSVSTLSGGQRTRLSLAKMLLGDYDLLLLDEPTNHLDMPSVEWLEDFLKTYRGAFIVISHDRYFLDTVTTRTIELYNNHIRTYDGNYSVYLQKKAAVDEAERRQYENTQKEIRRIEGIIAQQKRWNQERNYVTIRSKQKEIDRLSATLKAPEKQKKGLSFDIRAAHGGGNEALTVTEVEKSFDGKPVFRHASLNVFSGERVFIIGPNGCGKSTLLNILTGSLSADGGEFRFGARIEPGYFEQRLTGLNPENDAVEELRDAYPQMSDPEIRNALGAFSFRGDEVWNKIKYMSGGECARIALLKLVLSRSNFLILDEPTNHLDIDARSALEEALDEYDGTLLIVSHDRYLINRLADRLYYLDGDGTTEYAGNYDFYREESAKRRAQAQGGYAPSRPAPSNGYQLKKERESALRRAKGALSRVEERIAALEEDISKSEDKMMAQTDYQKLLDAQKALDAKKARLQKLYDEWAECDAAATLATAALEEMA